MELLECCGLLASEILSKAVDDWRLLIKRKAWLFVPSFNTTDPIPNKECNFTELRNFFKSDWCDALCYLVSDNVCKETILKILEKELEDAMAEEQED